MVKKDIILLNNYFVINKLKKINDAIKTVALPIVLKYHEDTNDNNLSGQLLEQKIVHQKNKKGDINGIINRKEIEVDENGCIIF